jgi:uncharacterized protein (DUF488 family)
MLNRQRLLLLILREAGGAASRLEVTKWAFLIREETATRGGTAYFQFLPYKYGPYSFCLYQEAAALSRYGLIEEVDGRTWAISRDGVVATRGVNKQVRADVIDIVDRFRGMNSKALLRYVYEHYPWYTAKSELGSKVDLPVAPAIIYTAGYEGLLVDGFLNGLLKHGIRRLVDVRNNPVSRRYGFHKGTLSRLCGYIGLEYVHFPELGIDSASRRGLAGTDEYNALFRRYEGMLLARRSGAIQRVAALIEEMPSVLVCMEADPTCCHRSRLATAVAGVSGLPVRHLELGV